MSDDGERLNALLSSTATRMVNAGRDIGKAAIAQGKKLADSIDERSRDFRVIEYHYLDRERNPKGPVTRADLATLFEEGHITNDTPILESGGRAWQSHGDVLQASSPTASETSAARDDGAGPNAAHSS
ncbi:MAG: GYF domain-containing protein [Caulobacterales bacterium]